MALTSLARLDKMSEGNGQYHKRTVTTEKSNISNIGLDWMVCFSSLLAVTKHLLYVYRLLRNIGIDPKNAQQAKRKYTDCYKGFSFELKSPIKWRSKRRLGYVTREASYLIDLLGRHSFMEGVKQMADFFSMS